MIINTRSAGIFLHPTSLPSPFGIGDFSEDARQWIDMLAQCGQQYWQVCPFGPTGYGNSPYSSLSSYAGNIYLISPQKLARDGLLKKSHLSEYPSLALSSVDYTSVYKHKDMLFAHAYEHFKASEQFDAFCESEAAWLDDFAIYMVLKQLNEGKAWYEWEDELRLRNSDALGQIKRIQAKQIRYHKFLQFVFHEQWNEIKQLAGQNNIKIIGDIPYYVAYDSCDCWACPEVFELDDKGNRLRLAGVPPDYFSADGQLWGNPVYRWDRLKEDNYEWWMKRIEKTLSLVDIIRLDHFRGFEAFWAVQAGESSAREGEWVTAPGADFFAAAQKRFGSLPFIAEDLGLITDNVRKLLQQVGLEGMSVLQFAFDDNPENPYLPYNVSPDSVMYTGTHDNDTSVGWFRSLPAAIRERVRLYLGCSDEAFLDYFIRTAYASPARLCILPLQDIIGLDSSHRFNTPGTGEGNWQWRFSWSMVEEWMLERIAKYTKLFGRNED